MITDEMVQKAVAGIKQRLTWPSMHWGVEGLHPDALPHIARATLEAAASLIAAQALKDAAHVLANQGVIPWDRNSLAIQTLIFLAKQLQEENK